MLGQPKKKGRKKPHRNSKEGGKGATKSRSVWAIDDDEPEPESDSKSDELGALLLQHCDRCVFPTVFPLL